METSMMVGGGLFVFTMVICLAFLHGEGLWGNALTLINMLMASVIAINAFEPVANLLEGFIGGPDYMDTLGLWLVFIISFGIMRLSTDGLSRMKLRFPKNVEQPGTFVFAGLIACLFYAFVTVGLYVAPIQPTIPSMRHFEANLYNFWRYESGGALASFLSDREFDREATDPENNFLGRYTARRVEIAGRAQQ